MTTWTSPARNRLDDYLNQARSRAAHTGADADEVAVDLQRHIETEIAALRLPVVTEEDLQRILARTGGMPEPEPEAEPERKREHKWKEASRHAVSALLIAFGIVLPLVTLVVELATHMCAGTFFDPLPTWLHVVLVALVPAANAAAWFRLRSPAATVPTWLWAGNAVAVGTALYYSGLFLPMSPFALIGILYLGFGLLPLSPLIALVCTLRVRRLLRLRAMERQAVKAPRVWWLSVIAPVVVLALFALPEPLTRHWLHASASDSPRESLQAIRMLRTWGSEDVLLRECYGRRNRLMEEFWTMPRVTPEQARQVYYRVTGKAFNAVPPPLSRYQRSGRDLFSEFEWDEALGSDAVAGQVRGLSMHSSRMDGLCNAAEGWSYTEWTMEFRNEHEWSQREARLQMQLPPGGVVSRLTLWVNGEPREAAFAGRGEVREAYQKIAVQQRRDPVLVTTCGPDRVLVQCFPIPPKGGTMKIRLGITAPLIVESANSSAFRLPDIVERNFKVGREFKHSCWVESETAMQSKLPGLTSGQGSARHAVRGEVLDSAMHNDAAIIRFSRVPDRVVRARDSKDPGRMITQTLQTVTNGRPSRIAVVLDGSEGMAKAYAQVARALDGFPRASEVSIWLAQDGVNRIYDTSWDRQRTPSRAVNELRGTGGQDNIPALLQAWEWAQANPNSVLLWIHDSQPVILGNLDFLQQRLEWKQGADAPRIVDVPIQNGPNRVLEQLAASTAITGLVRLGSLDEDLERLVGLWAGRRTEFALVRASGGAEAASGGEKASGHVVRLWALDAVRQMIAARNRAGAVELAAQQQLVTPVSGAVVLETAEQYRATGLSPSDPATVPVVPEPQTWVLVALAVLLVLLGRRFLTTGRALKVNRR